MTKTDLTIEADLKLGDILHGRVITIVLGDFDQDDRLVISGKPPLTENEVATIMRNKAEIVDTFQFLIAARDDLKFLEPGQEYTYHYSKG